MSLSLYFWAIGIATSFVIWPIMSSKSGMPGAWLGLLILVGSVIGNLAVGGKAIIGSPMFTIKALAIVLAAGIVNGAGVYFYGVKLGELKSMGVSPGAFVTVVVVTMAVLALPIDKGLDISFRELMGIAAIGFGLWLIKM